jgi:hypothetical protein
LLGVGAVLVTHVADTVVDGRTRCLPVWPHIPRRQPTLTDDDARPECMGAGRYWAASSLLGALDRWALAAATSAAISARFAGPSPSPVGLAAALSRPSPSISTERLSDVRWWIHGVGVIHDRD